MDSDNVAEAVPKIKYLICPCTACGDHIEFPAAAVGQDVECPHCRLVTTLVCSEIIPVPPPYFAPAESKSTQRLPSPPTTRKCPYCAELILREAIKCKHCGEFLGANRDIKPPAPPRIEPINPSRGRFLLRNRTVIVISAVAASIVFVALLNIFDSGEEPEVEANSPVAVPGPIKPVTVPPPNPFATNSIVYSTESMEGLNRTVCAPALGEAYAFMVRKGDTDTKVAISLGRKILGNPYTDPEEYKNALAQYVLDKVKQGKLFLLVNNAKLQIIKNWYDGDPPGRTIYECRLLEPRREGLSIFIEQQYLASKPSEVTQAPPSTSSDNYGDSSGMSVAQVAAIIGVNLPKGRSREYYEQEIQSGVETFDPNHRLTETDKQIIRNTADKLGELINSRKYVRND